MARARIHPAIPVLVVLLGPLFAPGVPAREYRESDHAQRITPQQVMASLIEGDGILVVDVRGTRFYVTGHVPGAWDLNSKDIYGWVPDLEQYEDRGIVFYDADGLNAPRAAGKLLKEGFRKVFVMQGNLKRWQELGYPLETGPWR